MAGAAAWNQLRQLRHRDLLLGTLLRNFERDQLECRILQSDAFRPALTRWTDSLMKAGKTGACVDHQTVPDEVWEYAKSQQSTAEVRWLLRRLSSGDSMHRGPPHYPSILQTRGPQYPFEPFELTYLRSRTGSMRLTELSQKVELPEVSEKEKAAAEAARFGQPPRDLWAEGCMDDDDHTDFTKAPR
eukprot:TRINITY_DN69511_c0_g1_i1.p1 TRINITY_DN69511_c0_g1~~TRINITY_DN69511_c0_g1_i1.p1  ORF type:complete len:187 (+),score=31.30 TRINITY_DN69511_c0_g1_i1:89-649(+)